MNKEQFADYVGSFNRSDFEGFGKYYTDDVVVDLPSGQLRGRDAVLDFYRKVKARVRETLKINQLVMDEGGIGVEMDTEFYCMEDWPDFVVRPMKKGDTIAMVSFILYRLRDGKIAHVRSARYRMS